MSRILMVASEVAPFAKTGGLADVLGALPPALVRNGEEVAVVMPRYRVVDIPGAERVANDLRIVVGPHIFNMWVDQIVDQGVRYYFVNCPPLYDRAGIYGDDLWGHFDNPVRFAALSQAAIAVARYLFRPDIFHVHDWQCGLLPVYLRENYLGDPTFFGTKCLLTIHNLGYQGNFGPQLLGELGLSRSIYHPGGVEFYNQVSFLKGGVVWSDAVTTVSPTYAREIQTPEFGFGFDGLMRSVAPKLTGILNGIDFAQWDPETDPNLPAHYSAADLTGKQACKKALLEEMGLPVDLDRPLIGIVSRFASQKGFDIFGEIAASLYAHNVAFAILGSGEAWFEEMFRHFAAASPEQFGLRIGYDDALAHRIEAGSDIFLMPSRYEPCGLNQMYSLRYGTVPIVRATGGLEDTVDEESGFKFRGYEPEALAQSIRDALEAYDEPKSWRARMLHGMAKDNSWAHSAREYQKLYGSL
jgi:starch synthase